MIERLEQQKRLTSNQWKLICTANLADLLDFFDLFLIGYVTAALTKEWSLTYLQGGAILMASGIGAPPGAWLCGWLGDRIGRRTLFIWSSIVISLATGIMVFTPGPDGIVPGWLFLVICRVFVGVGNAGIYTIDLPLVLVFMIRYWVPESPRWLIGKGRIEEARSSLAWALMINPNEIQLPTAFPEVEKTRWSELFKYPRLVASGMLTGLTQTGGASLGLWGATLLVLVMRVSPADAAYLMIWVSVSAVLGRFFITALIEPLGRRGSATLCMVCAGVGMIAQGYLYDVYIGGWSLFYVLFIVQTFFGSANYSVVGPYMAEIWPARLRASGMGISYGTGNLGKFIGPLGLSLIMGAGDVIKPAAPNLAMLGPAFIYFAAWYALGLIGFWVFGYEPKGRTFDEIDETLAMSAAPTTVRAPAV